MPLFRYRAVNPAGEVAVGEYEAANEAEIVDAPARPGADADERRACVGFLGAAPTVRRASAAARVAAGSSPKVVTRDQLLAITRELATLLRAGLPLDRALEILIGLAPTPAVTGLLQGVRDDVRGGKALSQALDDRREVFSRFYVNIVRAGEAGGALGVVLQRLADTMERNKELRESVKSALVYPTILIGGRRRVGRAAAGLGGAAVRDDVRAGGQGVAAAHAGRRDAGQVLSRLVVGGRASACSLVVVWFRRRGRVACGAHGARPADAAHAAAWATWSPRSRPRASRARWGRCSATASRCSRRCRIVKETMGNVVMAGALDGVIARLREGKGFGRPLAETGLYPRLATQMILVGEESGRLEEMLGRVAEVYDREVQAAVKRFLAILEPALILGLAVVIGGIVFSILMGVLGMSELVV